MTIIGFASEKTLAVYDGQRIGLYGTATDGFRRIAARHAAKIAAARHKTPAQVNDEVHRWCYAAFVRLEPESYAGDAMAVEIGLMQRAMSR